MQQSCYMVLYQSYAEGKDANAYWYEEAALEAVKNEVEVKEAVLRDEGYEPEVLSRGEDHFEVYVPGGDIYYEWDIILSTIE